MNSTPARLVAAISLVAFALLTTVAGVLEPEFVTDPAARLAAIDEAGGTATVSLMAFVLAQLPFLVGAVALAVMAHPRAPRLATAGGTLAVLGAFGHAVVGGTALVYLAMAGDVAARAALGAAVDRVESGIAVAFMAAGMLGTLLGLLLLGIALFRSRVVPRWIPVAIWAFLVVEFVGANLTAWATPAAALLLTAACGGAALTLVRREPLAH